MMLLEATCEPWAGRLAYMFVVPRMAPSGSQATVTRPGGGLIQPARAVASSGAASIANVFPARATSAMIGQIPGQS